MEGEINEKMERENRENRENGRGNAQQGRVGRVKLRETIKVYTAVRQGKWENGYETDGWTGQYLGTASQYTVLSPFDPKLACPRGLDT